MPDEWKKMDHLVGIYRIIAGVTIIMVLVNLSIALFAIPVGEGAPFVAIAAILGLIGVFMLPRVRTRLLERSKRLSRTFPLPFEEARRRLEDLRDLERTDDGRSKYRAKYRTAGATVHLFRAPGDGTEVEVQPADGEADVAGLKELLDGALNGEAQG